MDKDPHQVVDDREGYLDYQQDQYIIDLEKSFLHHRDASLDFSDGKYLGLALSGGGIRSATFSLGVMQALAKRDILKQVDYLSTVSGGGYIGSSLTWFLHKQWQDEQGKKSSRFGLGPDDFPFGTRPNSTRTNEQGGSREKMSIMRHLRQNLNYLFPGDGIGPQSFFAVLLRGFAINFLFYGPFLILLLIALAHLSAWYAGLVQFQPSQGNASQLNMLESLFDLAVRLALLNVMVGLLYALVCFLARFFSTFHYQLRRGFQRVVGASWLLVAILLIIASLPVAYHGLLGELSGGEKLATGSGMTIGGILSALWAFVRSDSNKKPKIKIPLGLIVTISAIFLLYGILLLAFHAVYLVENSNTLTWLYLAPQKHPIVYGVLGFLLVTGYLININFITLHRYYRDRLMELFMPEPNQVAVDTPAHPARSANKTKLSEMCRYDKGAQGPYHIINANVMLPGSRITKFSGRGGDNFVLTPLYCGSSATGWRRTDQFLLNSLTLPSAMAVSGAAVNPHTAPDGEGPTRHPLLSSIMAFLNIRMGLWTENPKRRLKIKLQQPNLWIPALFDIFAPTRMNENSGYLQLSDGGHFENLAVYELIRREVDLILLCDGAADKDFKFKDFANLVEKVRLDFGAKIYIDLDPLIPQESDDWPYGLKKLARSGYQIGVIEYSSGKVGFLIYLKTTLTEGLPADLYVYKLTHNDYPDETTGDQFFDEKQFEAYRELGYQLGKRMLQTLPAQLEPLLQLHSERLQWVKLRLNLRS